MPVLFLTPVCKEFTPIPTQLLLLLLHRSMLVFSNNLWCSLYTQILTQFSGIVLQLYKMWLKRTVFLKHVFSLSQSISLAVFIYAMLISD